MNELRITDSEYRHGYGGPPALHQSLVGLLLEKSEYHAWEAHPLLGGKNRVPTKSIDGGTISHAITLGQPLDDVVKLDFDSYRTKAAQAARDNAHEAGKTPILARDFARFYEAANACTRQLAAAGWHLTGESEKVLAWTSDGCPCRARLDHVIVSRNTILDLKFVGEGMAHPKEVDDKILKFDYRVQAAAYTEGYECCGLGDFPDYRIVSTETEPPYIQTITKLSGERMQIGRSRWMRAKRLWVKCLETNTWPNYGRTDHVSHAKPWELTQEMENSDDENL